MSGIPLIGERAPEFRATTTKGVIDFPRQYLGKYVVLFSHPADFTPVCTTEFVAFAKRYEEFKKLNCEIIGLSIDQVFSHIKWIEWIKNNLSVEIPFPIIADDRGKIAELYGMIHPAKGTNTVRTVFIIDEKGTIRCILYYPQELGRNVDEILRIVEALKVSDNKGVAIPANWPNNELIGNSVIIPPATNEKEIKDKEEAKKKGEIECYDWWFCYKKL